MPSRKRGRGRRPPAWVAKKPALALLAAALLAAWGIWQQYDAPPPLPQAPVEGVGAFTRAASGQWMTVQGTVDRVLADDNDGSRHQRFIVRVAPAHTLLVAHNIDLAPRLDGLRTGQVLQLRGEYVWNEQGGLIHWTHRDPRGRHAGGYIEWMGRRYQ